MSNPFEEISAEDPTTSLAQVAPEEFYADMTAAAEGDFGNNETDTEENEENEEDEEDDSMYYERDEMDHDFRYPIEEDNAFFP